MRSNQILMEMPIKSNANKSKNIHKAKAVGGCKITESVKTIRYQYYLFIIEIFQSKTFSSIYFVK